MANRRMFSMKVVDTDAFCDMPSSAQNLYYHIGMRADDEGFYAGVRGLMAKIHASVDDLNVLLARGYILDRGDGVYVVKHWKMNNYLQNDRIKPTEYEEKRIGLYTKRDGSYTLDPAKSAIPVRSSSLEEAPICIQNVSIEENSIDESNIVQDSIDKPKKTKQYAYTREQIEKSERVAKQCLEVRKLMESGTEVGEAWMNTLTEFADSIQAYEDAMLF